MSYRGTVRDGLVVPEPGVQLPEGLQVIIHPVPAAAPQVEVPEDGLLNGVPVFPLRESATAPDLDLVNKLRD